MAYNDNPPPPPAKPKKKLTDIDRFFMNQRPGVFLGNPNHELVKPGEQSPPQSFSKVVSGVNDFIESVTGLDPEEVLARQQQMQQQRKDNAASGKDITQMSAEMLAESIQSAKAGEEMGKILPGAAIRMLEPDEQFAVKGAGKRMMGAYSKNLPDQYKGTVADPDEFFTKIASLDPFSRMFFATMMGLPHDAIPSFDEYLMEQKKIYGQKQVGAMLDDENSELSIAIKGNDIPTYTKIMLKFGQIDPGQAMSALTQYDAITGNRIRQRHIDDENLSQQVEQEMLSSTGMLDEDGKPLSRDSAFFSQMFEGDNKKYTAAMTQWYASHVSGEAGDTSGASRVAYASAFNKHFIQPFTASITSGPLSDAITVDNENKRYILPSGWQGIFGVSGTNTDEEAATQLFGLMGQGYADSVKPPPGEEWTQRKIANKLFGGRGAYDVYVNDIMVFGGNQPIEEDEDGMPVYNMATKSLFKQKETKAADAKAADTKKQAENTKIGYDPLKMK